MSLIIRNYFLCIALIGIVMGCAKSEQNKGGEKVAPVVPDSIEKLNNLTVYSSDQQPPDTVELRREQVFETNKEVLIKGNTGDVAVDESNRVYVVGSVPGTVGVYVFKPDGSFITKFARAGRGPGEFVSISEIKIQGNRVYMFDPKQKKISVYSTVDYTHVKDMVISRQKVQKDKELASLSPTHMSVHSDGSFVMEFRWRSLAYPNKNRNKLYYKLSAKGKILPGKLLQTRRYGFYLSDQYTHSKPFFPIPRAMPFSRGSLTAVTDDGQFYTVWNDNFLIKLYDEQGKYRRAFYYPYSNSRLDLSEVPLDDTQRKVIKDNEDQVPASWPAIHTMELDDQGRLWVFTITDSKTHYKGWVLNKKGKLLARFNWSGQRASRSVMSKSMLVIKNGYLYTRERDISKKVDRIVKYKINFKKR